MTYLCVCNFKTSLVQIMACRLFGAKPLSLQMLTYYQSDLKRKFNGILFGTNSIVSIKKIYLKITSTKWLPNCLSRKVLIPMKRTLHFHYNDVIMGKIASQITSLTIVYSTVYSDTDQGKHQSSASLAFVRGIHRGPVNSPHKGPVTRKMFPFDDVIKFAPVFSK